MYDSRCPSCKGLDVHAFLGLSLFPFPFLDLGQGQESGPGPDPDPGLVSFPDPSWKAESGSGFWLLSPFGLLHSPVCKSSRRPQSLLGQPKTGCNTSFHYFRIISKYDHLRHAIVIRSSAIWLVISNLRLATPHLTRNVAQNTRTSSHVWEGLGTRLARVQLRVWSRVRVWVHVWACLRSQFWNVSLGHHISVHACTPCNRARACMKLCIMLAHACNT